MLEKTSTNYYGWSNDGTPGATFAFAAHGPRDQATQSPRKDPLSSWAMHTGGFETKPDFGAGIHLFFESGRRPVTIGCKSDGTWGDNNTDDCAFHDVKVCPIALKTLTLTLTLTLNLDSDTESKNLALTLTRSLP